MDLNVPPTLTTTVFSQCRSGRFEAGPYRQTSEGRALHHFCSFSSVMRGFLPLMSDCCGTLNLSLDTVCLS